MPLLNIPKPKKEEEWKLTSAEQEALKTIPLEQVKSANHDPELLNKIIADEARDADPSLVRQALLRAVTNHYPPQALAAVKNLSTEEKQKAIRAIRNYYLRKPKEDIDSSSKSKDAVVLSLFLDEDGDSVDLFHFFVKLEQALTKKR